MTIQERAEEIVDDFEMFDGWEDRYGYIIEMGRTLPSVEESEKTEENRVHGCQSRVWLVPEMKAEGSEPLIDFRADSDAAIVKGLLALVHRLYGGEPPRDILDFDFNAFLQRLDFDANLSMTRGNGLRAVVTRLRQIAAQQAAQGNAQI